MCTMELMTSSVCVCIVTHDPHHAEMKKHPPSLSSPVPSFRLGVCPSIGEICYTRNILNIGSKVISIAYDVTEIQCSLRGTGGPWLCEVVYNGDEDPSVAR